MNDRQKLARQIREFAEGKVDEILKVMPEESKKLLLRRAIARHIMDGSCATQGIKRIDHMLAIVKRLKAGESNKKPTRRYP